MRSQRPAEQEFVCKLFEMGDPGKRGARDMNASAQILPMEEMLVRAKSRTSVEKLAIHVPRYGLVITLLLIGVLKFTIGEAQGIQPLMMNSPLMFWL
jgi:hypothetical protein